MLPGHGIAGILGAVILIAAVVLSFGVAFFFVAAQAIAIAIVLSTLTFFAATRVFPENALMRRLTFAAAQGPDYVAAPNRRDLIGKTGVASSYLRPAGVSIVDGKRVDVLTEGDFVAAGTPVVISRVEGARIFVRPINEEK